MGLPVSRKWSDHQGLLPVRVLVALAVAGAAACTTADPVYIASVPPSIDTSMLAEGEAATLQLTVPVRLETAAQAGDRAKLATKLGLPVENVPTTRRDDFDIEIEWSIVNPSDKGITARLGVVGANELFRYDPAQYLTAAQIDDEEDPPPPLMGGRPIEIAAGKTATGVFREDELSEAAQDLDAFTRGGVNATRAILTQWQNGDITGGEGGIAAEIPAEAVPLLLQLELTVSAGSPVIFSAELRVRDRSGRLDPNALDAATLVAPSTNVYMPPPPPAQ